MNSLQQELDSINQQLEHLNARKAQLEPIISEYSDVVNRVRNLVSNMIDVNVEPSNLMFDIQDLVNLEDEPDDTTPELTPEPQPGQDFPTDWINATTEAHSQPEDYDVFYPANDWEKVAPNAYYHNGLVKLVVPWVNVETLGEVREICDKICHEDQLALSYEIEEYGDSWLVYLSILNTLPINDIVGYFFPEPDTTPEPTPQPVKMFAFIPGFPIPTPALTQEPTPEPTPEPDSEECSKCEGEGVIESAIEEDQICPACGGTGEKPEPQPEPVQINMQAYRRGDDVLIIGFSNKRLMNQWSKWFKSIWGDQVHVSDHSDNLQGFNHCLTVLWFGNPHWERLTKLNYSLKPTEQKHQSSVTLANSEEE